MLESFKVNCPIQELHSPLFENSGVRLFVKREDLIHPLISGNKFRKLKYNLIEAEKSGYKKILSFGGAFSNHIYSLAAAGKIFGFKTIGVIRGEKLLPLNPTLSFAESCGMKLIYLERNIYRNKADQAIIDTFQKEYGPFYYVPEGGSNHAGVKGCEEILSEETKEFDYVCTASGTGGTLAGLINSINSHQKILGFCALKGSGMLDEKIKELASIWETKSYEILYDYHFGGYAKITDELINFMESFNTRFGIQLEPVYTAKMFYGLIDLISKKYFPPGSKILALHTGGLQGLEGMKEKMAKVKKSNIFEKIF